MLRNARSVGPYNLIKYFIFACFVVRAPNAQAQAQPLVEVPSPANRIQFTLGNAWYSRPKMIQRDGPLDAIEPVVNTGMCFGVNYVRMFTKNSGFFTGLSYARAPMKLGLRLTGSESPELEGVGVSKVVGGSHSVYSLVFGLRIEQRISQRLFFLGSVAPTCMYGALAYHSEDVLNANASPATSSLLFMSYTAYSQKLYAGFLLRAALVYRTDRGNDLGLSFSLHRSARPYAHGTYVLMSGSNVRTYGAYEQFFSCSELVLTYAIGWGRDRLDETF